MLLFWLGRRFAICVAAAVLLSLAAGGFLATHGVAATAQDVAVAIDDFAFGPAVLKVRRGTRVVWTNKDDEPHTVVADGDPHLWRSPPLDTDDSFSFVFDKPGTYKYFCTIHPRMQGTVIVE
jgi:plastocyanin